MALAGCARQTSPTHPVTARLLTVPCTDSIGSTTSSTDDFVLLGRVGVVRLKQPAESTAQARWTHFAKRPVLVLSGHESVSLSLPVAWRRRAAIVWGNSMTPVAKLRIAACPPSPHRWNVYAGGIYTRSATECIPLVVGAGGQSRTVMLGLGESCRFR